MKNIYIRENIDDIELSEIKIFKFINKIIIKIIKKFNIIKVKKYNNDNVFIVPNINDKKLANKIINKIKKEKNIRQVVLSDNLKDKIKGKLIDNNIKICEGKILLKYLIEKIIKYILDKEETNIELQDIYFLVKDYTEEKISMIKFISDKVKSINIITNKINIYKKLLEEEFYEQGKLVAILNNKKKSLKRAKIIINVDFEKEELTNYNINREAIIINLKKDKIDNLKFFDGIIINMVEINYSSKVEEIFKEKNIKEEFSKVELYESILDKNNNYFKQIKRIYEDKVQIISLIGNNGIISEKELLIKKNFLTNERF